MDIHSELSPSRHAYVAKWLSIHEKYFTKPKLQRNDQRPVRNVIVQQFAPAQSGPAPAPAQHTSRPSRPIVVPYYEGAPSSCGARPFKYKPRFTNVSHEQSQHVYFMKSLPPEPEPVTYVSYMIPH